MLIILNGNLGSSGTHVSLADILSFCSFLMLDRSYALSLFSKYILLVDYHTYGKVDFLILIRKMHELGCNTLAFFSLYKFDQLNCPGICQRLITLLLILSRHRHLTQA